MADSPDTWEIQRDAQPRVGDYGFDLDRSLSSVVALSSRIPADAFTAESLGTARSGNAVLIDGRGIVLTIGYLVTEAEQIWLTTNTGRVVPGHVLGLDHASGFALVQALGALEVPFLPMGSARSATVGQRVVVGGAGGRRRSLATHVVARQEFAGYWEYVLDEAVFTSPAHPNWGGTALIGPAGDLLGIGSLQIPQQMKGGRTLTLNMIVPIDLLAPIFEDLRRFGRPQRPPRPWLGLYATETDSQVMLMGFAENGPARRAGLNEGDIVRAVAGRKVDTLAAFFRNVWALGEAGVDVSLTLEREGDVFDVRITSSDRDRFLKTARLH